MAVRIIVGHLKKESDPLVAALSKIITTNVLWASDDVPHPICVLGEVNSIRGHAKLLTQTAVAGGHEPSFAKNPSITIRHPRKFVADTVKCIISLNGTDSNPKAEKVQRRTQNANARSKTRKRN